MTEFFGLHIKPNKAKHLTEELSLRLIHLTKIIVEDFKPKSTNKVYALVAGKKIKLASLRIKYREFENLSLFFHPDDQVTFINEGPNEVTLSGSSTAVDEDEEDDDTFHLEEETPEDRRERIKKETFLFEPSKKKLRQLEEQAKENVTDVSKKNEKNQGENIEKEEVTRTEEAPVKKRETLAEKREKKKARKEAAKKLPEKKGIKSFFSQAELEAALENEDDDEEVFDDFDEEEEEEDEDGEVDFSFAKSMGFM